MSALAALRSGAYQLEIKNLTHRYIAVGGSVAAVVATASASARLYVRGLGRS